MEVMADVVWEVVSVWADGIFVGVVVLDFVRNFKNGVLFS